MHGASPSDSSRWRWREPLGGGRRCPRCGSRMKVTAVSAECVYCGTVEHTSPAIGDHDSSVLPSIRHQVEEDILEQSETEYRRPRFASYNQPRQNNTERYLLAALLFLHAYLLLKLGNGRRSAHLLSEPAEEYVFNTMILPYLALLCAHVMPFVGFKRICVWAGVAVAAVGLAGLLLPWSDVLQYSVPEWLFYELVGFAVLAGLWSATLLHRDARLMLEGD